MSSWVEWRPGLDAEPAAPPRRWRWGELDGPARRDEDSDLEAPEAAAVDVESECARREAEALERGREEGARQAEARLRDELESARTAMRGAVERFDGLLEEWRSTLERDALALALGVARRVVEREVETDPEIVVGLVRSALSSFPMEHEVGVRLHPEDLTALSTAEGPGGEERVLAGGHRVRWIPDPAVGRGGCVVEGPEGVVDGRVDRFLESVYWEVKEHD